MNYTRQDLESIFNKAEEAAKTAISVFEDTNGQINDSQGACGFAWVDITGIKFSTKFGRLMKSMGFEKDYKGDVSIWNPSGFGGQRIDIKERGASAYARVLQEAGFTAYAGSRLD